MGLHGLELVGLFALSVLYCRSCVEGVCWYVVLYLFCCVLIDLLLGSLIGMTKTTSIMHTFVLICNIHG